MASAPKKSSKKEAKTGKAEGAAEKPGLWHIGDELDGVKEEAVAAVRTPHLHGNHLAPSLLCLLGQTLKDFKN